MPEVYFFLFKTLDNTVVQYIIQVTRKISFPKLTFFKFPLLIHLEIKVLLPTAFEFFNLLKLLIVVHNKRQKNLIKFVYILFYTFSPDTLNCLLNGKVNDHIRFFFVSKCLLQKLGIQRCGTGPTHLISFRFFLSLN